MNAAAIIREARRLGVRLIASGKDSIRWRCDGPLPEELRQRILGQRAEILALLRADPQLVNEAVAAPVEATKQSQVTSGSSPVWGPELLELIRWFQARHGDLPLQPFDLQPWQRIVDPAKWFLSLLQDIACGPDAARARLGGLACDLRRLRELFHAGNDLNCRSTRT
jgi:hypothetical protein